MLECVANLSEGRDGVLLAHLSAACASSLLDVHSDPVHNRSVFTLAGPAVLDDAIALARAAAGSLDLREHEGVHPRLGVLDVVPFVPLGAAGFEAPLDLREALDARDQFAESIGRQLSIPCFRYGPERSLPDVRRNAFRALSPDFGPLHPHPRAGACCVGARGALIAYNIGTAGLERAAAAEIVRSIRTTELRALAFDVGTCLQISCNLIDPANLGLVEVYDRIASLVEQAGGTITGAELVGLVPQRALDRVPKNRWSQLGLDDGSSIEARFAGRS